MIAFIWGELVRAFTLIRRPFAWTFSHVPRRSPKVWEIDIRLGSYEDAKAFANHPDSFWILDRIRFMRGWERSTRNWVRMTLFFSLLEVVILVFTRPLFGGLFNYAGLIVCLFVQEHGVRSFVDRRDLLLKDLEEHPIAQASWYDAMVKTRKAKDD